MTPDPRRWSVLVVLCVALIVVALDNTILNVALPSLVRELNASNGQLQWIVDAYTIVFASALLVAGSLGDRFGRKGALQCGLVVFAVGSVLSAFAGSADQLIYTRGLMGLGGALIMPSTLSILTNVFPTDELGRAIGIWAGVSGLGIAIGPSAGGWLLEHFWWGSVFLVNIPVIVIGFVAVALVVPTSRDPAAPPLDFAGFVLSASAITAILYGIIEAPSHGWSSRPIVLAFAIGLALLTAFILWERHTPHPMLDVRFFKNPRFSAASVAVTLVFFALFGSLFFLSQYLQFVLGYSPLQAGLRVTPIAGVLIIAAPSSSVLVRRFGTKIVVTAGLVIVAGALFLLTRATVHSGYPIVLATLLILGLGMGIAMAPATESIMSSLPPERAGVGSAVNDTTRLLGGALGVAVLGSVMRSTYVSRVDAVPAVRLLPPAGLAAVRASVGGAAAVAARLPPALGRALLSLANQAFVDGMRRAVIVGAIVALAGALVALIFLPARSTAAPTPSDQADQPLVGPPARPISADGEPRPVLVAAFVLCKDAGFANLDCSAVVTRGATRVAISERASLDGG
ncbi:MAG: drug resistance transporter, EmrB/QacA subfamily [Actinomycetia bacterium]|nr:drug resistance transporter, EmrB/QacA subfamily [Actinomycetes bacterium]